MSYRHNKSAEWSKMTFITIGVVKKLKFDQISSVTDNSMRSLG